MPDDYLVVGSLSSVQRQVGNAVPSALAEILALAIRSRLLGDDTASGLKPTLLPQRQLTVPPPEAVVPLRDKYLRLVGNHSPHPGTGKGHAAERRGSASRLVD
jgi:DNA (cytosine-5)-methyltransferase 1